MPSVAMSQTGQVAIPTVEKMPNLPRPYVLRDWDKVARDMDAFLYDFDKTGEFLPLPWWDKSRTDHDLTGLALPAYVGDSRQGKESNGYDAITSLGAVLGATKAGIDKSRQHGRNWVEMLKIYYSWKNGTKLYMNRPGGKSGQSFWYELFPSLLFFQIYDHYRGDPEMREQLTAVAQQWYQGCVALGATETAAPDFDHTAFDFGTGRPFDNPRWREPDAAAAVAWLEYMAYVVTGDKKFLQAARWGMQFLAERKKNPFYECLLPYGAYLSARMNAEQGTDYPTGKLINWVFDGTNPREWGIVAETWGGIEAHGLQGSVHKGSEYAFAMTSFLTPAVMVPLVRYDDRFARAMGKWVLNVAVNSRYFYANAWKPEEQTSWDWAAKYDPGSVIAYEGLRKQGMRRDYPDGQPERKILRPDAKGTIEQVWKIDVSTGERSTLVVELDEGPRPVEIALASSGDGPWKTVHQFEPGKENRFWRRVSQGKPLWIRLRAEPLMGGKPSPLRVRQTYVETRLRNIPHVGGDPLVYGWGRTDFGLYGSVHVGLLAALIEPTNVEGILRIDCRATESFAAPSYPTYLFYNPHAEAKEARFPVGEKPADLYDTVAKRVVARGVRGEAAHRIEADSAAVLVVCPAGGTFENRDGRVMNAGIVVDYAP